MSKIVTREQAAAELLLRQGAEDSLYEFTKQAWGLIEGNRPFLPNWHLEALAEHLEAQLRGQIRNLLVNVPPRTLKSGLCSVMLSPWVWINVPSMQFLYVSYAQDLSVRDSRRSRQIIESNWYATRWGNEYSILTDQNAKIRFDNSRGGYRLSSSVDAKVTGEGGDWIVCLPYNAMVLTEAGEIPIGDIVTKKLPYRVAGWHHGKVAWQTIDKYEANPMRPGMRLDIGWRLPLVCTGDHRVWLGPDWVPAKKVIIGDFLWRLSHDKTEIEPWPVLNASEAALEGQATFNLRVPECANYFANGVLVHNCDDPNNVRDRSETMLKSTLDWWQEVMPSRLNDFKTGRRLVVAQRMHESDLSGHILSKDEGEWTKLILPMEFEPKRKCFTVVLPSTGGKKWCDPRTVEGELLFPARIGPKELKLLKRDLGSEFAVSGQLQQRPAPEAGGIIKRHWFKIWTSEKPPPMTLTLTSIDTAVTANKLSAYNVATTWGVFLRSESSTDDIPNPTVHMPVMVPNIMLLSMWRKQCEYHQTRAMVQRLAVDYLDDDMDKPRNSRAPKKPDIILIEAKSTGITLIQDMRRAGVSVWPYNPDKRGDKLQRVHLVTPIMAAGRVWLPGKPPDFHEPRDWIMPLLWEALAFPNGSSRDIVDTISMALDHLNSFGFVWHPSDPQEEEKPREWAKEGEEAFY